jgi:FeS assembly SUF system regulator
MLRIGRLTDYGIVLMRYVAARPQGVHTANEIAAAAALPLPTVSKLLRKLAREGLLVSQRGVKGGYGLARPPQETSVADIITAIEGPIALTLCSVPKPSDCEYEPGCPLRGHWQMINEEIRAALDRIRLSELAQRRVALPLAAQGSEPVESSDVAAAAGATGEESCRVHPQ